MSYMVGILWCFSQNVTLRSLNNSSCSTSFTVFVCIFTPLVLLQLMTTDSFPSDFLLLNASAGRSAMTPSLPCGCLDSLCTWVRFIFSRYSIRLVFHKKGIHM